MNEQQQIQLPDQVTLTLKTQDVGNILSALETGAYKVVLPIINSIQGQLLAQQLPKQPAADSQVAE